MTIFDTYFSEPETNPHETYIFKRNESFWVSCDLLSCLYSDGPFSTEEEALREGDFHQELTSERDNYE